MYTQATSSQAFAHTVREGAGRSSVAGVVRSQLPNGPLTVAEIEMMAVALVGAGEQWPPARYR